jgi:ABC-2 type transport system ATP-binding protein
MTVLDFRLAESGVPPAPAKGEILQPAVPGAARAPLPGSALAARGLRKSYGRDDKLVHALVDVDLELRHGEILGVLGPNGAGKTTLVSILEGLLTPDAGQMRLMGTNIDDRAAYQQAKARVGVSMQHSVLPPTLTIAELVGTVSRLYPKPRACAELIEQLGLSGKQHAEIRHLSGGQQQRVAVALALVGDPDVVFLDEPTSQLDPQARRAVWEIVLEQRRRRNAGVLLTTHQMEEAQRLCDRVLILDRGRVLDQGTPHELVQRHCPQRRIEFIAPAGAALALLGQGVTTEPHGEGEIAVSWRPAAFDTALADLMAASRDGRIAMRDLRVDSQTLEDVFIQLTGRGIRA